MFWRRASKETTTVIETINTHNASRNGRAAMGGTLWVRLADLRSDPSYQREMDPRVIKKLADAWDDNLCEVITVNRRTDGSLYVVEGQKRVTAKRLRFGDDEVIECKVVSVGGPREEKALFDAIARGRTKPTGGDLARSDMNYGVEPIPSICAIARRNGLYIQFNGTKAGGEKDWTGILYSPWLKGAYNRNTLESVLRIVMLCFSGKPQSTNATFLSGLEEFLMTHAGDLKDKEWKKLANGLRKIDPEQVLSRARDLPSWRSSATRCAEALLSLSKGYLPRRVTRKD